MSTSTAQQRNEGALDKPVRRRAASGGSDEPRITYSVRDAIRDVSDKIDSLAKVVGEGNQLTDRRLNVVEQNAILTERHSKLIDSVAHDFAGFEQRFRDHERNTFHSTGEAQIAKLLSDVENLKVNQLTQKAVKDFTDEMIKARKDDRRWLIGVSVTLAIFVLREVLPIMVRTAQAMPTPTMP